MVFVIGSPGLGQNVLVIGGGPSGRDVVFALATKAKNVFFSTHRKVSQSQFPDNVTIKPDIKEFQTNGVLFSDETEEDINAAFYCTGKFLNAINQSYSSCLLKQIHCRLQILISVFEH